MAFGDTKCLEEQSQKYISLCTKVSNFSSAAVVLAVTAKNTTVSTLTLG